MSDVSKIKKKGVIYNIKDKVARDELVKKYEKPVEGIPEKDLSKPIRDALNDKQTIVNITAEDVARWNSFNSNIDNKVDKTTTVNGKPLSGDIELDADDVGAVSTEGYIAYSQADKDKLANIQYGAEKNVIKGIKNSNGSVITPEQGYITLPEVNQVEAGNTSPKMNSNTASVGTSSKYAREDHVHPKDTSKINVADIVNNLTTSSTTKVLSAEQGRLLNVQKADKTTTYTKTDVDNALANKQDVINDLSTIRTNAGKGVKNVAFADGTLTITLMDNTSYAINMGGSSGGDDPEGQSYEDLHPNETAYRNRFIQEMNTKAQAIGMTNTTFYDPAGNQPVHHQGTNGKTMANSYPNYWTAGNLWSTPYPYINTMTARDAVKLLMYAKSINTLDQILMVTKGTRVIIKTSSKDQYITVSNGITGANYGPKHPNGMGPYVLLYGDSENSNDDGYEYYGGKPGSYDIDAIKDLKANSLVSLFRSKRTKKMYAVAVFGTSDKNNKSNKFYDAKNILDYIDGAIDNEGNLIWVKEPSFTHNGQGSDRSPGSAIAYQVYPPGTNDETDWNNVVWEGVDWSVGVDWIEQDNVDWTEQDNTKISLVKRYGFNPDGVKSDTGACIHPASVSKLMTMALFVENMSLLTEYQEASEAHSEANDIEKLQKYMRLTIIECDRQPPTGPNLQDGDNLTCYGALLVMSGASSNTIAQAITRVIGEKLLEQDRQNQQSQQ